MHTADAAVGTGLAGLVAGDHDCLQEATAVITELHHAAIEEHSGAEVRADAEREPYAGVAAGITSPQHCQRRTPVIPGTLAQWCMVRRPTAGIQVHTDRYIAEARAQDSPVASSRFHDAGKIGGESGAVGFRRVH